MKRFIGFILIAVLAFNLSAAKVNLVSNDHGYQIMSNSNSSLDLEYDVSGITTNEFKNDKGVFTEITMDNGSLTREIGTPALPTFRNLIEVSEKEIPTVEVLSFEVKEYSLADLGINSIIAPAQPSYVKDIDPALIEFKYNKASYELNSYTKSDLISIRKSGSSRGTGIANIVVSPFQYNPVNGMIKVYSNLKIRVNFNGAISETKKSAAYSPYFKSMFSSLINYKEVSASKQLTTYPVTYLVVASDALEGNAKLDEFIAWKTMKGFTVIENYVSSSDNVTAIDSWIDDQYTNLDPKPSFVMIVGDMNGSFTVQSRTSGLPSGVSVSDHTYGVEGTSGSSNLIPSMYVGRFSVRSQEELDAQVDKTIWYEKGQFEAGYDTSYLTNIMGVAGVDGSYATTHGNPQIMYGEYYFSDSYNNPANGVELNTNYIEYLYPASGNGTTAGEVRQYISDGVSFYNYTAHGGNSSFGDPQFTISQVNSLGNTNEYPLVVGNCCLTGSFADAECFGESWLNTPDQGGIGFIGASMSTYWDEDLAMGVGLAAIGNSQPAYSPDDQGMYDGSMLGDYPSQAGTMTIGLLAVENLSTSSRQDAYWHSYHLFGDPSLQVFFGEPQDITVDHLPTLAPGLLEYTITTWPNAYVALSDDDGVLHGAARADETGEAVVGMDAFTSGSAHLVVTAQFGKTYLEEIDVVPASGPYPVISSTTASNNNYGELCTVDLVMGNVGVEISPSASIVVTTENDFATIVDGTETFGDIAVGAALNFADAISFNISGSVPDQEQIILDYIITDTYSKNEYAGSFSVTANAPAFEFSVYSGAGTVYPGDIRDFTYTVTNIGHADANNVDAELTQTTSLDITITDPTQTIGNITVGNSGEVLYSIEFGAGIVVGTTAALNLETTDDKNASNNYGHAFSVGMTDDFESGSFTADWQMSGSADWFVSAPGFESDYCAESGDIDDSQVSEMSLDVNFEFDGGKVEFDYYVSSEGNWDYLRFYIDGAQQGEWAGDVAWASISYEAISAGAHTLKWAYEKDSSVSSGDDLTKIDNVLVSDGANSIDDENLTPKVTTLYQNYPNPFNPSTKISFFNKFTGKVKLTVFNSKGEVVSEVINREMVAGNYNINYNASMLNSGVYFYKLSTKDAVLTKKMILVK